MKLHLIKYSLANILQRRLRSSLTILSILIGIAAIFALISFGIGIQQYVNEIADAAGRDKIFIQAKGVGAPGTDENFFLSQDDVDFVKKIKGVDEIVGIYLAAGEIKFKDEKRFNFVAGLNTDNLDFIDEVFTVTAAKGRHLKKGDVTKVLLGHNYQIADKIFDKPLSVGDKILINGEPHEVVGFYGEIGNPSDDANVYVTVEGFEVLFPDRKDKFGFVMVGADSADEVGEVAIKIEDKLRKFKDQEEGKEDFFVQTFEDALETFGTIFAANN